MDPPWFYVKFHCHQTNATSPVDFKKYFHVYNGVNCPLHKFPGVTSAVTSYLSGLIDEPECFYCIANGANKCLKLKQA